MFLKSDSDLKNQLPQTEGPISEILLHSCCAPCSGAILECLMQNGIAPTIFYFNPNIFPQEEYEIRKSENQRHAKSLGLKFVDADYGHAEWIESVRGLEEQPERGSRCLQCFKYRLLKTAEYAQANGFKVFTTTLFSSRHKDFNQITEAGNDAALKYPQTIFWVKDWRKNGLGERAIQISKENNFYRQRYCGCEFAQNLDRTKR
jgi:Uncharacterized protein conserved in bacteria